TSRRVACDAGKVVMRHDANGNVLDVGRKTRTIPPALRRALASRDRHCRFPGCEAQRCDAHHVEHWADGGATKLDNLVLLCRRHHRAVHEEGFGLTLDAEGQPRFTRPGGGVLPRVPAPPAWSGAPLAPTDAKLAEDGIAVDANTSIPNWAGERLDLPYVIGVAWRPGGSSGAEETAGR
ncbi:MAG: HNH endonuclease, partial [Acidobacteria bacterium]|nr:HNH endonuclease [Acidobacteriota bacterium]